MSIHEQMGWVRYREIQDEIGIRDRERLLRAPDATGGESTTPSPSIRRRIGWGLIRVGVRIAAVERS
jgi:hypothetical protein